MSGQPYAPISTLMAMFDTIRRAEMRGDWTPERIASVRRATRIALSLVETQQRRPLRAAERRRLIAARDVLIANRDEIKARHDELKAQLDELEKLEEMP